MSFRMWFAVSMIALANTGDAQAQSGELRDADAELLREAKIGTSGKELLAQLGNWCGNSQELLAVDKFGRDLDSDLFEERTAATDALVRIGAAAAPALLTTIRTSGIEARRRAEDCLSQINKNWKPELRRAAVRRLVRLHPEGTFAALMRHLPWAGDEELVEDICFSLFDLAKTEPNAFAVLAHALRDPAAARRAAAGCILGRLGSESDRASVRKLLSDSDPTVRLRAAQGLLAGKDASGIPTLIELLSEPAVSISWPAEELLRWASCGTAPRKVLGTANAHNREQCRDAWREWCANRGKVLDWARISNQVRRPALYFVLTGQPGSISKRGFEGTLSLMGSDGGERWSLQTGASSVELLPGNRILIRDTRVQPPPRPEQLVKEKLRVQVTIGVDISFVNIRDLEGKILWEAKPPLGQSLPRACRFLPNGHVYVTLGPDGALQYGPQGTVAFENRLFPRVNQMPELDDPRCYVALLPNGRVLCTTSGGPNQFYYIQCDARTGREITRFQTSTLLPWLYVLANGNYLIGDGPDDIQEINPKGQAIRKYPVPYASGLSNRLSYGTWPGGGAFPVRGGGVIGNWEDRFSEVSSDGRVLWE